MHRQTYSGLRCLAACAIAASVPACASDRWGRQPVLAATDKQQDDQQVGDAARTKVSGYFLHDFSPSRGSRHRIRRAMRTGFKAIAWEGGTRSHGVASVRVHPGDGSLPKNPQLRRGARDN